MRLFRLLLAAFALGLPMTAAAAETIAVAVPEMDCEECSHALVTTFERRPELAQVQADLVTHILTLTPRPGSDLDDATIRRLVKASGFSVDAIRR